MFQQPQEQRNDLQAHIAQVRPWSLFFDRSHLSIPKSATWKERVQRNLTYFRMNYIATSGAVFCVNVLFRPSFLVGLCIIAFAWYFLFASTNPIQIGQRVVNEKEKMVAFAFVTALMLWIFSVGIALFWILGISSCLVLGHSAFYEPVSESGGFERVFGDILDS